MTRRSLSKLARIRIFDSADGICHICQTKIHTGEAWQADHILPLALGGEDNEKNMAPAHEKCHLGKTKVDISRTRKADRQRAKHLGIKKKSTIPGSKNSRWKKKLDGTVVER